MKTGSVIRKRALIGAAVMLALGSTALHAADRSGREVVETVCVACHGDGKNGAPKIGDRKAWAERASHGFDKLVDNAIEGVRSMPAHGGQAALSDLEMTRAVAYMVSSGITPDPRSALNSRAAASGEGIVASHCQKCHAAGVDGAPRIGEMSDWKNRLGGGVDRLVKSASTGHNSMPARGGLANLSDKDIRAAVEYMVSRLGAH